MLKKFSSDKINGTENALFFYSRAPTYHNITFHLQFLHVSRVCRIFYFRFHFVFMIVLFLFNKMHGLYDFETS